jgi:DNA invertase Pin-like site-specific DNA recombinase
MRIGYARVSTEDQNLDLQHRALLNAGCDAIYEDQGVSGVARRRPNLDRALATLNPGDMLIVWKLDRLGRSLIHLVETIRGLGEQGVGFLSLNDSIDTMSPTGRLVLHVSAAFAEFERDLISERTRAGMQARKARGERIGRRPILLPQQIEEARLLLERPGQTKAGVARVLKVSRATLSRALQGEPQRKARL